MQAGASNFLAVLQSMFPRLKLPQACLMRNCSRQQLSQVFCLGSYIMTTILEVNFENRGLMRPLPSSRLPMSLPPASKISFFSHAPQHKVRFQITRTDGPITVERSNPPSLDWTHPVRAPALCPHSRAIDWCTWSVFRFDVSLFSVGSSSMLCFDL
jgi:hypothetical protein